MESHRKQNLGLLLFMVGITHACGQLCVNCLSSCMKPRGFCFGHCVRGWDGPTCSRRNVAFGQVTRQSSVYSEGEFSFVSSLAVDGRTGHKFNNKPYTCAHTLEDPQPAFWLVTLDAQYNIYRFRIYNRNGDECVEQCGARLNGFTLSVGNSSNNYKLCYKDTTTAKTGPGNIINKVCDSGPLFGDTVKIVLHKPQYLTLCEVEIFVCTPGTYGELCENRCGNCAEGPSVCDTTFGNCPERTPRCMPGYAGFKCDLACTPGIYGADCVKRCGHCADDQPACDAASGKCTDTSPRCMPGYSGPRCDTACHGTYGPDCRERCGHCSGLPTVCDVTSGNCAEETPRCMPGYTGVKCDTDCTRGTYGPDCEENCGFCAEGSAACNSTSGYCPDREPRCALGYSGLKCATVSSVQSPNYTGLIVGCAVGISVILIIGIIVLVFIVRRFQRNAQAGGATTSTPNNTSTQESSFSSEAIARSEVDQPSSPDDSLGRNSCDDRPYEFLRYNTSAN